MCNTSLSSLTKKAVRSAVSMEGAVWCAQTAALANMRASALASESSTVLCVMCYKKEAFA